MLGKGPHGRQCFLNSASSTDAKQFGRKTKQDVHPNWKVLRNQKRRQPINQKDNYAKTIVSTPPGVTTRAWYETRHGPRLRRPMRTCYQPGNGPPLLVRRHVREQARVGLERAKSRCPSLGRGRRGLVLNRVYAKPRLFLFFSHLPHRCLLWKPSLKSDYPRNAETTRKVIPLSPSLPLAYFRVFRGLNLHRGDEVASGGGTTLTSGRVASK